MIQSRKIKDYISSSSLLEILSSLSKETPLSQFSSYLNGLYILIFFPDLNFSISKSLGSPEIYSQISCFLSTNFFVCDFIQD